MLRYNDFPRLISHISPKKAGSAARHGGRRVKDRRARITLIPNKLQEEIRVKTHKSKLLTRILSAFEFGISIRAPRLKYEKRRGNAKTAGSGKYG
jgi:hypothetical protein